MTVFRGFAIIIASAIAFGSAGGLTGFALAKAAPGYYPEVFGARNEEGFNSVQVGVGLGVTQGLIAGLIVGCVVIVSVALARRRDPSKHRLDLG
jgi:hypothetical protein